MRTLGHNSGSTQLLVVIERVEVASLCIKGEGDRRQGCLLIPSACAPLVAIVVLGSCAPQPTAATPPDVALPWSPPLRGDKQPDGTAMGCVAETSAYRVAAPPAGALGGRMLPSTAALPRTPVG
jgi:hypothetical protein